jgi:hypothetical protein
MSFEGLSVNTVSTATEDFQYFVSWCCRQRYYELANTLLKYSAEEQRQLGETLSKVWRGGEYSFGQVDAHCARIAEELKKRR